ncbi:hypothetical protein RF11_11005 [Thelohanellus kitauei]|uniref:Uncharacterized protein n=1 Tax=Thelohanellus kitauei TaxID=669202 RepID=A0A0C2MP47_THEKT|nr:hypothetical protein RF11_11005 [Thelohanellus kitauei]
MKPVEENDSEQLKSREPVNQDFIENTIQDEISQDIRDVPNHTHTIATPISFKQRRSERLSEKMNIPSKKGITPTTRGMLKRSPCYNIDEPCEVGQSTFYDD